MKIQGFEFEELPDGRLKLEGCEPMSKLDAFVHVSDLEMQRVRYETQRKFDEMFPRSPLDSGGAL